MVVVSGQFTRLYLMQGRLSSLSPSVDSALGGFLASLVKSMSGNTYDAGVRLLPKLQTRRWRGKFYPNGEFGFTREKRFDVSGVSRLPRTADQEWALSLVRVHGLFATLRCLTAGRGSQDGEVPMESQGDDSALDLTKVSISEKTRKGLKGISSKGKRIVRNGAYLLEKDRGKGSLSFLTLTLPRVSDEGFDAIASNWGRIVEHIVKAIRRRLSESKLPSHVIGVTEVQEKRFKKHGGIPLHLHLVFVGRHRRGGWVIKPEQIRKSWKDACENVLPEHDLGHDWRRTENIQTIKKSVCRYLSKYLSKGVESVARLREKHGDRCVPHQWHTCTRELRKWIERETKVPENDVLEYFVNAAINGGEGLCRMIRLKVLTIEGGRNYLLAGSALLTNQGNSLLRELMRQR